MSDERLDLFAGGFAEALGAAEIDRVGLHQVGIELVLADQLAEAVADLGATVVSVLAIDRLGRELLCLPRGGNRFGERADLFNRADADAVGFAQGPVDCPGLTILLLLQHKQQIFLPVALQAPRDLLLARPHPRITKLSQLMRIALTSQNRFDDCLAGHSAHIA